MTNKPAPQDGFDFTVFISRRASKCAECGEKIGQESWILLTGNNCAVCLACADLDHLVFLPSGNTALTRRAKQHSQLHAVVLKWNRSQRRYQRQGLLVEEAALAQAERECLADEDSRGRQRERAAVRRAELDEAYVRHFAASVRRLFPGCPAGREQTIAEHACLKYSGRVGRSAGAKALEDEAIRAAVVAHLRHAETDYDRLLAFGEGRHKARTQVRGQIELILSEWMNGLPEASSNLSL